MRAKLTIIILLLLLGFGVVFAPPSDAGTTYLPMAFAPPPTPVPTPVPPPINTLTIQLSEMKSGYVQDTSKEVTNAEAAKTYHDPTAALASFQAQGRETSWYVLYTSTDYLFSDAVGVSNQVYRYLTTTGATDGFDYTIDEALLDHPDFRPFNISAPCCPVVGLRRTFTSNNRTYDHFLIIIQVGRYVTEVEVIGLVGVVSVDRAIQYAQLALNHLAATPQQIVATAPQ